jgi:hypothetical protein
MWFISKGGGEKKHPDAPALNVGKARHNGYTPT